MGGPWFEAFRSICQQVWGTGQHAYPLHVLLFYLARWRQKVTGQLMPDPTAADLSEVQAMAERIARNLGDYGERVERLFGGDSGELTELRRLLLASAGPRCGEDAPYFADEALQKIALVLLTGTPPSRAEERLSAGPNGPSNEYIFTSPFPYWAKTVVINLILDEHRRQKRRRRGETVFRKKPPNATDHGELRRALRSLPQLLEAIRTLPDAQRSVMVLSLCRRDVDELLVDHLRKNAPDMFGEGDPRPGSDSEIAELLATTPRLVAANRSAARRKLVRDPLLAQLLDAILPHRSTRPPGYGDQGHE
jgi:hypothetical protein